MRTQNRSRFATLVATFGLVFCSFQASPEDIDIFSVDENNDINNPNVLFVIENNSNWSRASQQWPGGETQGQSEMAAIRTVINELDAGINVGMMEYVTGGSSADTDFGYIRYHVRPMSPTNRASFTTILNRVYNNINDPAEKRASGNPYGSLFHDIYNYLAGVGQANKGLGTPADPATVTGDTEAYKSPFSIFQSPLTTLDTCTRTIVVFISNNQSPDPTPDSQANIDALHALAGGGAAGNAAISQISLAEYTTQTTTKTDILGYTPACYGSEAACSSAVNAATACAGDGYTLCSCSSTDFFPCPSNHYTVVGTNTTSETKVVFGPATTSTPGAPTNLIGATCKQPGQIPASATCPSPSTKVQADTPTTGTTRTTNTTWADCKYVATDQTGCTGTKFNYEIQGTRTDTVTDRQTFTMTTRNTLGETTACYADPISCSPTNGPWNCALYNQGCACTTAGSSTGCEPSGSKQHRIIGEYQQTSSGQTGTFAAASSGPYMLDEWARFLRQSGVPIPGLSTRAQVTTYTIDVFNANQNPTQSALLFNAARVGGGKYFQAKNRDALINALRQILTEVQAVNSAFSSASLPVNATNRAQNENQVFIGVFKPDRTKDPGWFGNLKRYQLVSSGSTIDLGDRDGNPAINNQTGFLTDCAVSFWSKDSGTYWFTATSDDPDALGICATNATSDHSDLPDGPFVEKGAVAGGLRMGNTRGTADAEGNFLVERDVYTVSAGALAGLTAATFDDGNVSTDETFEARVVRFIRGEDVFDEDADYGPLPAAATDRGLIEPRSTIHGDVVHSRPQPINYGGTTGVVVFYGSNDGHFRAVRASTGEEIWSFVAPESFPKFARLFKNEPLIRYFGDNSVGPQAKDYFFDGSTGVFQTIDNSRIWIFPTLRRGGRRIYGLNVTNPAKPVFMWSAGCDSTGCDLPFLGQTWGLPNVAFIKGYCGIDVICDDTATPPTPRKPVIVLAGGYDKCDDANTWSPPCTGATGTGVYVLDAETGKAVRYFDFADLGGRTGFGARSAPADVALIDIDSDTMVDYGYAVDTGGNIYRMDFVDGPTTRIALDDPVKWLLSRVAYTNGAGRKFLFPPSLVQITSSKIYLAVGSGDREHPLKKNYPYEDRDGDGVVEDANADGIADVGVLNRFYVFKNDLSKAYVEVLASDPAVATGQAVALNLDGNTMTDYSTDGGCTADPVLPNDAEQGWFTNLGAAGKGEQVVTSAVIAGGFVFFSTNRPTETSTTACTTSLGEARGYFMNLLNASGAIGVTGACGGTRSSTFVGGGLPPSPVLATVPINGELRTVVIGAVQKTGEPSSPIQSQRVQPPIPSVRKPIYWYKSTGDK